MSTDQQKELTVIKRSGVAEAYNPDKTKKSITAAMTSCGQKRHKLAGLIVEEITNKLNRRKETHIPSSELENLVKSSLSDYGQVLALTAYGEYRALRRYQTDGASDFMKCVSEVNGTNAGSEVLAENANKDGRSFGSQRDLVAGEVSKAVAKQIMPPELSLAHQEGIIHIHDLDYFSGTGTEQGIHPGIFNCDLVNLKDMLENGFVIKDKKIVDVNSILKTAIIVGQIVLNVSGSQYGGQTISASHMAPAIKKTRERYRNLLKDEITDEKELNSVVERLTKKEVRDAIKTLNYQINSYQSTSGQTPFVSLFLYQNEDPEYKEEMALLIEELFKLRIEGIPNANGVNEIQEFPKLLYVLDEDNIQEGAPNYYLTELAAKCVASTMAPDFISAKIMGEDYAHYDEKENMVHTGVFPCMGAIHGDETISYKINGIEQWNVRIRSFYDHMKSLFDEEPQYGLEDNPNKIIKLQDVEVYDIKEKGFVKCHNVIKNETKVWLEVGFSNVKSVFVTEDHPFTLLSGETVQAKDLRLGDEILASNKEEKVSVLWVEDMVLTGEDNKYSYDVETETKHFEFSGIYSHNCRSFLSKWIDPETGLPKYYGRFNKGVQTINLPDAALTVGGELDEFWSVLDERLELIRKVGNMRQESLVRNSHNLDGAPILWKGGAISRLKRGESFKDMLYGGYSTISLGFIGLDETVRVLIGKSLRTPEGQKLGEEILAYLKNKTVEWNNEENIGWSLYGTPAESACYTLMRKIHKRFPNSPDCIKDHEYLTNSYHISVREDIDAFEKLTLEAPLARYCTGGAISYVEVPNLSHNIPAILEVIKHGYNLARYFEINTTLDLCNDCGSRLKLSQDKETGEFYCGDCGSRNVSALRRVCGYLGRSSLNNAVNRGKRKEMMDRKYHL